MAKCSVCEGEMRKVKGCSNHIGVLPTKSEKHTLRNLFR